MMKDLFRRLRPLAAVAGASLVSLLMYGYSYKASPNLSQLLPFINKLQNPELYPRDMYVASMPSFPSLYPKLVALAVSPEWLAAFHACAYAAVLLLFFWLLRKLALLFFSDELTADIACLLAALSPLVAVLSLLGDDPIIKTSFYQTTLAAPATLAALYLFLTRRYFPALLIAGGLYWINALPANYLAGLLAAGTLAAQDRKKTIAGWVCFAIFATSWFVWKSGLPNVFAPPSAGYLQTLYKWYSGHYFALSWSGDKVIRAAGYIALFAMLFRRYAGSTPYAAQLKAFMWAFAAMWAAGFVFADLVPVPLVVMAQLFRSDTLFIVFGVLLCSRHIAALLSGNGEDGDYFLAGILMVVLTELEQPVLLPGAVLLVAARMFYPRAEIMIAAVSAVICAVYAFAVPVYALQNGAGALLCAGLFSCLFFRKDVFKIKRRVILPLALAQCLVVMAERAGTGIEFLPQRERDWYSVQLWARDNTPVDAMFFTPMRLQGFRSFSRRSTVIEWLDGAAMHWAPGFEKEWVYRIGELYALTGGDVPENMRFDQSLRAQSFVRLGKKYGAGYVIDEGQEPLPFSLLYSEGGLKVYRLPGSQGAL